MSLVSGAFIGVMIITAILYYLSPKKFKPYVLLDNKCISLFKFRC